MSDAVVLVMTCKKFEQLWDPFFILFDKYWGECPYEIILGTDSGSYDGVKTIEVGSDLGWASNCKRILEGIPQDNVILFMDDYLLREKVDNDRMVDLVDYMDENDVGCLRTCPCPGPTSEWTHNDRLGILQAEDPYRLSLQTAIWKKETLLDLLVEGESPWETEIKGTKRAKTYTKKPFLSVKRGDSPLSYEIAVIKGEWRQVGMDILKEEGIPTDKITKRIK